jgi:hypothetical protein
MTELVVRSTTGRPSVRDGGPFERREGGSRRAGVA